MCGRYALALRPSVVRYQLQHEGLPVDDAPDDDATRQSYNVAPEYYKLVYRADVPDWGAGASHHHQGQHDAQKDKATEEDQNEEGDDGEENVKYKLQAMKWGLVPFWTKRNPDYGSMLKTINCRDDSLIENRGMWNTMKQKKRCVVVCQGFYEWLKKNGGKEKIPYFVKRKDGRLMCFTGLWDCVQYEDQGSEALRIWLDPKRSTWSAELQALLKPYKGELEVYSVTKDVRKVGNNSPTFIVPISSSDNKQNIANFFCSKKGATKEKEKKVKKDSVKAEKGVKKGSVNDEKEAATTLQDELLVKHDPEEDRKTMKDEGTENNAPLPVPKGEEPEAGMKRKHEDSDDGEEKSTRQIKTRRTASPGSREETTPKKSSAPSSSGRKTRSATSNTTAQRDAKRTRNSTGGSKKITNFFGP
ncbi:MAG: hypothetical protein M1816_005578 [Peltula sp. TS41687]|nr:MAG: hypothetical protein M1816_005578 [Peltula sp. TS41687]